MVNESLPDSIVLPPNGKLPLARLCSIISVTGPQMKGTTKWSSPVLLHSAACPANVWEILDE